MTDDDTLGWLLPILERRATVATRYPSYPTGTVSPDVGAQLEVGMTRSIDRSHEARHRQVPALLV
jgi:hypothetical protein